MLEKSLTILQSKKRALALSQIRFCKEFLGSLSFGDAVYKDIHEEPKNKLTTKFAAKGRICDNASITSRLLATTAVISTQFIPTIVCAEEKKSQLPTVTVIDSNENKDYRSAESSHPRIKGELLNSSRTISTVSRQLIDDQGVTRVSDALRNAPGVSIAAGEGGAQGDNLTIRGFSARSDFYIDGMRDFGSYFRDPFNIESIEVVQGPSSILFGRGATGGAISQNFKQAFLGTKKSASLMLGSNNTTRATADLNTKIDGIDGAAFRLNAMAHRNEVARRDEVDFQRAGIAPTLAFGLGGDTRLNLSYLHQNENNLPDYGVPFFNGKPAIVSRDNFYGFKNDDYLRTNVDIATATFEHDFSDDVNFRNQARYARYFRSFRITEPKIDNPATQPSVVTRNIIAGNSVEEYFGNQADINSKFSTFKIKHDLTTGILLEKESSSPTRFTYSGVPNADVNSPNLNDSFSSTSFTLRSYNIGELKTTGIYALDNIELNKKWLLSLGTRFDNIQADFSSFNGSTTTVLSRSDNVFSYNAGLVYKPKENGSIYINYGTSFNPSAENFSFSNGSENLKPEQNTIYEIGTKWDLFKKRLSTNLAIFRAEKTNARENNGVNNVLSGTQRTYGFQGQINGSITENWKAIASYTYLDAKVTESLVNPAFVGLYLQNVPKHSFNIFTTYTLPSHLEIGGGANFVSKRFASSTNFDPLTGNPRSISSYLTFNLMAKYPLSKNVDIQLNVNNLTNRFYYDQLRGNNAAVPGEGRVFLFSTNFKF